MLHYHSIRNLGATKRPDPNQTLRFEGSENGSSLFKGEFSPDGLRYAQGDDKNLIVWDLRQPDTPLKAYGPPETAIVRLHWHTSRQIGVVEKKSVRIVDLI